MLYVYILGFVYSLLNILEYINFNTRDLSNLLISNIVNSRYIEHGYIEIPAYIEVK